MTRDTSAGARPRAKRLDPVARRQALLSHGIDAFTTMPYDEVAVADIAVAAGVSEGLIFRYFGDKRSFYVESLRTAVAAGMDDSYSDPAAAAPERFRASLSTYFDFAEENPQALSFLVAGTFDPNPEVREIVNGILDEATGRLIARMGVEDPSGELFYRARQWVVFTQLTAAGWVHEERTGKDVAIEMLISSFRALVGDILPRGSAAQLP